MCFYDTEPCEVYNQTRRKARKEHVCDECRDPIRRGNHYDEITGIFDGSPFRYRICLVCRLDHSRVIDHERAEGCDGIEADPGLGRLWEGMWSIGLEPTPRFTMGAGI
jgi:hypothetical protein